MDNHYKYKNAFKPTITAHKNLNNDLFFLVDS